MESEKKLIKNTIIYAIGNFGSKILSYIMVLVYSYFIEPNALGYYDLIITTISMLVPIVLFSMNEGAYRFLIKDSENDRKKVLGTSFRFVAFMIIVANIIFMIFNQINPLQYSLWISLYLTTLVVYSLFQDYVRGLENNKLYAIIGLLNSFFLLGFEIIGLLVFKMGILALILGKVFANILCIILMFVKEPKLIKICTFKFDKVIFKELFGYSAPLVPNTVCWWIVNSSDRYIVLFFLGTAFNGIYSMANKFPTIVTTITGIFYLAWQESAIKEYDSPNRDNFFSNVFEKYSILLFTVVLCAIPATKIIFELLVASAYTSAWKYTGFLYVASVFSSLCSFLGMGYQISKETSRSIITTIFAAIINIIINVCLIKSIGLQAASFSTASAYFFLFIIRLQHTKRYFTLKINWKIFYGLLFLCIGSMGLIFIETSMVIVFLQTLVSIIFFGVINFQYLVKKPNTNLLN